MNAEGYSWPGRVFEIGVRRQRKQWEALHSRLFQQDSLRDSLIIAILTTYPSKADQILPTRFGNALRAVETYSYDRYGLDLQIFWSELSALSPDSLRSDLDEGKALIDLYVSFIVIASVYSLTAIGVGIVKQDFLRLLTGLLAIPFIWWCYSRATTSAQAYLQAVRAMVNIGRSQLAEAYSLALPLSVEDERRMWQAQAIANYRGTYPGSELDRFRKAAATPSDETDETGLETDQRSPS